MCRYFNVVCVLRGMNRFATNFVPCNFMPCVFPWCVLDSCGFRVMCFVRVWLCRDVVLARGVLRQYGVCTVAT
jgi:hypothetical protein